MNLTNKNTGDNDVKVFKLNIQEYWEKYLESEETEVDDTLIDLDTTVDEVESYFVEFANCFHSQKYIDESAKSKV